MKIKFFMKLFFGWLAISLYRVLIQGIYPDDYGGECQDRTMQIFIWVMITMFIGVFINPYISIVGVAILSVGLVLEAFKYSKVRGELQNKMEGEA